MEDIKVEMMKVADIKPYEKNPRYNDNAVSAVAKSIQEFGFKTPIVVDKNNVIICGHTRWKASKLLGLEEVPVIKANDLSDAKAKAYRIADNKTAELSSWDYDKLQEELRTIDSSDMLDFGFTEDDLNIQPEVEDLVETEDWIEQDVFDTKSVRLIITYSTPLEEKWLKQKVKEKGILKDWYKVSQIIKEDDDE